MSTGPEAEGYWDYPDGATFVNLFRHETVPGDASSRIWWETRVLINKEATLSLGRG